MGLRYDGKTAIVTGGANGIGRATALRLLREGGNAIVIDREPETGERAKSLQAESGAGKRLLYCGADMTDQAEVKSIVERASQRFGQIHILVNNAGYGSPVRPIEDIPRSEWDELLAVNVTATFCITQMVVPLMRERGYGRVVNMSSGAGQTASPTLSLVYSTAKAALLGFTRKLAYEEAPHGITVNAVAPGLIFTDRIKARFDKNPGLQSSIDRVPMKRPGTPEDIAATVLFLASDDASYVTGTVSDVNGGRFMA